MPNLLRASMADLIALLRTMVRPPVAAFADLDLQNLMDGNDVRTDVRTFPLTPAPTFATNGGFVWLDYYAGDPRSPIPWWEGTPNLLLQASDWTAITPDPTSNLLQGHWVMTATQTPPVYLTGACYDLNAAAALLCDQLAAATSDQYNMSNQGQSLARGQVQANWQARADTFRRQVRGATLSGARSDMESVY